MPNDAIGAVAELAASQHRAFTRSQAAALNFNRSRVATALKHGWLREPYPGVLVVVGSSPDWHEQLMAATLAAGGYGVASHRAAARLHDLDGFASDPTIELSITRQRRWRHPGDAIAHHIAALPKCDLVTIDGIPCTGLARTLVDLGSVVRDPLVVRRALTDARRRGVSLRWIHETAERLHRPGQRGTGVLLHQLARIPAEERVPDSWFEELLAQCLADPERPELVAQCEIRDADGRLVAVTDLGMPEVKLGLEAHSREFHFGPDAEPFDEHRDLHVAACGWELLYLGWYATRRPAEVRAIVKQVVAARRLTASALPFEHTASPRVRDRA